ncbi:PREDICTED: uncharacterized protein LOC106122197 [Papilio xuthus]|uniref:Uncharacterized protein LOC106122197 n=1 Tax=Papilio xuthus TaxID=66420 RepID=I4DQH4_PAPXU|nr:uncharacterized protein LOC106122197 precursor [Papilio xuthus]BAM20164.1 unknown secreted protein [Papilio xuthus]
MISDKILLCVLLTTVWRVTEAASIPFLRPAHIADLRYVTEKSAEVQSPVQVIHGRVREGVPPPLCAGRCASPPAGPVCAFDAAGTARTFATLCELEAVSCRESTYYAITSLGEC